MKIYSLLMFVICILTIVRCKDDDDLNPDTDYLIFGHFYGECVGEGCIEIFKLNGHDLFEDKNDRYPNFDDFYKGSYKRLPKKKFESVNGLIESFPQKLLNEEKNVIGSPDAGDWGGYYVEYNFNDIRKFWCIDKAKGNISSEYYDFLDKLEENIRQLN
ncbi:MAG: hypothetical protein IPL23_27345 [Saprospiraceae bacterium]|nr:hypothetical protein [Saprospiraceae bacterium]MBP7642948.1 hypothetical protein [Saprospiraceae bacterium]